MPVHKMVSRACSLSLGPVEVMASVLTVSVPTTLTVREDQGPLQFVVTVQVNPTSEIVVTVATSDGTGDSL